MQLNRREKRSVYATEIVVPDGQYIVREGDVGTDMYVIQSGEIAISKQTDDGERTLAILRRGEFFGEMSILESLPREASARAVGETRLLIIGQGGLLFRLRRDPTFALEMLHQLSKRLRSAQAHPQ